MVTSPQATEYLGHLHQVDILVDGHIAQLPAATQLLSDLVQILRQVCFPVLHSALSIIILLIHALQDRTMPAVAHSVRMQEELQYCPLLEHNI